jgi:hypothetical protein
MLYQLSYVRVAVNHSEGPAMLSADARSEYRPVRPLPFPMNRPVLTGAGENL